MYANLNKRSTCICGARRFAVSHRIWQVTDKEEDLIYPKYYYRCPQCRTFSAVNLYFPVDMYEDRSLLLSMQIDDLKLNLNIERMLWIGSQVQLPNDALLFDLGAGEGCFSHVFAEKYPEALVYAVEADARVEEKFYKTNPRVRFIPQYIEDFLKDVLNSNLPCPNLVLLTDVLEHVIEPEILLKAVAKILSAEGYAYITIPDASTFRLPFPYEVSPRRVDWEQANRTCQHLWMMEDQTFCDLIEREFDIVAYSRHFETEIRRDSIYSTVLVRKRRTFTR